MKKKSTIAWCVTLLCLVLTVVLWFAMRGQKAEYTQVTATVLTSKTSYLRVAGKKQAVYKITVSYDGETYELENAYNSYSYVPGTKTTAYLANGHLYANEAGVNTSTPLATVYFIFLFGTFGMVIFSTLLMSREQQQNKEQTPAKTPEEMIR